jgi:hypothetical protein
MNTSLIIRVIKKLTIATGLSLAFFNAAFAYAFIDTGTACLKQQTDGSFFTSDTLATPFQATSEP